MEDQKLPGVSDRVKAVFADSFIMALAMFTITYIFSYFEFVSNEIRGFAFIFIFFLYDPLFTTIFGGTIGHRMFEIRIKRMKNKSENIWLPLAFVRFFFKLMLGWLSLLTVQNNKNHQAIHDKIVGSIVLYKK